MRFYTLTNYYLSSIQIGIQTAHCAVDMFIKYQYTSCDRVLQLTDWARNHKTMVLLNGGNQLTLQDFASFCDNRENTFAWSTFNEDEQSLNNCLTCVGIILPDYIYNAAAQLRVRGTTVQDASSRKDDTPIKLVMNFSADTDYELTLWEYALVEKLNLCGLAK